MADELEPLSSVGRLVPLDRLACSRGGTAGVTRSGESTRPSLPRNSRKRSSADHPRRNYPYRRPERGERARCRARLRAYPHRRVARTTPATAGTDLQRRDPYFGFVSMMFFATQLISTSASSSSRFRPRSRCFARPSVSASKHSNSRGSTFLTPTRFSSTTSDRCAASASSSSTSRPTNSSWTRQNARSSSATRISQTSARQYGRTRSRR